MMTKHILYKFLPTDYVSLSNIVGFLLHILKLKGGEKIMIKQTLLATAALALAAVPAFAHSGTMNMDSFNTTTTDITSLSADVSNSADITNNVYTISNTGLNSTSTNGGDTSSLTNAMTGDASGNTTAGDGHNYATGGDAMGGNTSGDATAASLTGGGDTSSWVSTGNADATSTVSNVVNTTFIHF